MTCLTTNGREEKHQERDEAKGAADCVQCCPTLQELLGDFGVFVEGGVEEALVGPEDSGRSRSVYVGGADFRFFPAFFRG